MRWNSPTVAVVGRPVTSIADCNTTAQFPPPSHLPRRRMLLRPLTALLLSIPLAAQEPPTPAPAILRVRIVGEQDGLPRPGVLLHLRTIDSPRNPVDGTATRFDDGRLEFSRPMLRGERLLRVDLDVPADARSRSRTCAMAW